VQTAGDLVALAAELAARVQHRQAYLDRGPAHLWVDAHGKAAPVVLHAHGTVRQYRYVYGVAKARERLVDRVVDEFLHQVVKPALVC
jgi:hypothetical protein